MKRKLHDLWKIKEGSKTLYKVQAEKGVLTFRRKRDAEKWVNSFKKGNDFKYNMALKGYVYHETYKGYDIYHYTELYTYYLVAKENKILKAYFESKKGAKMYITRLEKEMFK